MSFLRNIAALAERPNFVRRDYLLNTRNVLNTDGGGRSADNSLDNLKKKVDRQYVEEDIQIKVNVRRSKRASKMKAADFVFELCFSNPNPQKNPLLISCCLGIYRALGELLELVREQFKNEVGEKMAFYSVKGGEMNNDIYIGGYPLSDNDTVDTIMSAVMRYLLSHTTLPLSSGLTVNCVVISKSDKKMAQTAEPIRIGGSVKALKNYPLLKNNRSRSLFPIPRGFAGFEDAFLNRCLIASLAVAVLHVNVLKIEKDPVKKKKSDSEWEKVQRLQSQSEKNQRIAGRKLLQLMRESCESTGVPLDGPHTPDSVIPICDKYNFQMTIFSQMDGNAPIFRHPEKFDPSRIPVGIYMTASADKKAYHCHLIKNWVGFFSRGFPCYACLSARSTLFSHKCTEKSCKGEIFTFFLA